MKIFASAGMKHIERFNSVCFIYMYIERIIVRDTNLTVQQCEQVGNLIACLSLWGQRFLANTLLTLLAIWRLVIKIIVRRFLRFVKKADVK